MISIPQDNGCTSNKHKCNSNSLPQSLASFPIAHSQIISTRSVRLSIPDFKSEYKRKNQATKLGCKTGTALAENSNYLPLNLPFPIPNMFRDIDRVQLRICWLETNTIKLF